jgi:hypothetical protein
MWLSKASIPAFEHGLQVLSALLDKAEAYAEAKKIDPAVLLNTRLYPDMFTLGRQVQSACDQAKNGGARLAGVDPPTLGDEEKTIADLRTRIAKTAAFLQTLDLAAIDGGAERQLTIPFGPGRKGHMRGVDYLTYFALPNFYFHITTAYDILRHSGVEIGKADYLGKIPMKML